MIRISVWNSLLKKWNTSLYWSTSDTAKKILHLKKKESWTPGIHQHVWTHLWHDFFLWTFFINIWCITNSLIYKIFCLQIDDMFQQTHAKKDWHVGFFQLLCTCTLITPWQQTFITFFFLKKGWFWK